MKKMDTKQVMLVSQCRISRRDNEKKRAVDLISPFREDAFTEPVLHRVVLSQIDFKLPDKVWECIDDGFSYYWNEEVGFGNTPYFNEACDAMYAKILERRLIFPFDKVVKIADIMFDFIELIPGATLDDDEVAIPRKNERIGS
jgi:hypothetical protein